MSARDDVCFVSDQDKQDFDVALHDATSTLVKKRKRKLSLQEASGPDHSGKCSQTSSKDRKPREVHQPSRVLASRKPEKRTTLRPSKGEIQINFKPEAEQFLKGLVFYWVPNDNKPLGRRIRMQRAQEWGAERANNLDEKVTHMIIEENWAFEYAIRHLGVSTVPKNVVVVNQDFLPACIRLKHVVDCTALRFQVHGYVRPPEESIMENDRGNKTFKAIGGNVECEESRSAGIRPNSHVCEDELPRQPQSFGSITDSCLNLLRTPNTGAVADLVEAQDYEVPDSQSDGISDLSDFAQHKENEVDQGGDNAMVKSYIDSTEDPHCMKVFQLHKQVPQKITSPKWNPPTRKPGSTRARKLSVTPYKTPSVQSTSPHQAVVKSALAESSFEQIMESVAQGRYSSSDSEDDNVSERENDEPSGHPRQAKYSPSSSWQSKFACMHPRDGGSSQHRPNAGTIKILREMADVYEARGDHWRALSYRRAGSALRSQDKEITTAEEAARVHGIGTKLAAHIAEISSTARFRKLDSAKADPRDRALETFCNIHGVGPNLAQAWVNQGFRTVEDVRLHIWPTLSAAQRLGIEHYDDFLMRIPRAEITEHLQIVNKILTEISWKLEVVIGGSYRRGAPDSGDIDFMITASDLDMPNTVLRSMVFDQLIPRLHAVGYLKATLSTGSMIWLGAAELPSEDFSRAAAVSTASGNAVDSSKQSDGCDKPVWRRVDILVVPAQSWGAALLYFTGNDIFNRSLRLLARRKGMRLNQYGLYMMPTNSRRSSSSKPEPKAEQQQRCDKKTLLESRSERRILELLGVPWREPTLRCC